MVPEKIKPHPKPWVSVNSTDVPVDEPILTAPTEGEVRWRQFQPEPPSYPKHWNRSMRRRAQYRHGR